MKSERKELKKELDELWTKCIYKKFDYQCACCGKRDTLQAHHIVIRKHLATRWDLDNGYCLCKWHHKYFAHGDSAMFLDYLRKRYGDKFVDDLVEKGNQETHWGIPDLLEIKEKLEEYLEN